MGIALFEHNHEAYKRAITMLESNSKAAIIHPTGTGKSFIGFKMCEDNPESRICWLSPSEYIWNTQLDNLAETTEGWKPDNVTFVTYARLVCMTEHDMRLIRPDYIILDEFHRCGASVWGLGVFKLLAMYSDAKILGLSATSIRYLDNRRDMADELFDGNVASEMSLGEAIVRGVLKAPKYVLSIYEFSDSLTRYEDRISRLRTKAQRDTAFEYFEELRRMIEQAEGLDEMFEKYMTDRHGKYIVFCSGYEAMQDAISKASHWFGKIDEEMHIYSVYSEVAGSEKEFVRFREDDSGHLRLLYCINALNEGVHVGDISGVVLLRPTVSPIIYKQQIGRCLSAVGDKSPVIFDVVNNIENLYSIDAVKEEMYAAINYYNLNGAGSIIVNDTFYIEGVLSNCLELFDALEDTLSSSWDIMYEEARVYYEEFGNLSMNRDYLNEKGYPVGRWVSTQRTSHKNGELSEERVHKLNAIGMEWLNVEEKSWHRGFEAYADYVRTYGDCHVSATFITEDGFALGSWLRNIYRKYAEGRLADGYIEAMERLGVTWEPVQSKKWLDNYECAVKYRNTHNDLKVPYEYVTDEGMRLGIWISVQRDRYKKGHLNDEQIGMLNGIDMDWDAFGSKWDNAFQCAVRYYMQHGSINSVPIDYKEGKVKLSTWIRAQRVSYSQGKLARDRMKRLESLDIIWNPQEALWEKGYEQARKYEKTHGNLQVPAGYITPDGYKLKSWLNNQATRYRKGRMSEEQRVRLEELGMTFGESKAKKAG